MRRCDSRNNFLTASEQNDERKVRTMTNTYTITKNIPDLFDLGVEVAQIRACLELACYEISQVCIKEGEPVTEEGKRDIDRGILVLDRAVECMKDLEVTIEEMDTVDNKQKHVEAVASILCKAPEDRDIADKICLKNAGIVEDGRTAERRNE